MWQRVVLGFCLAVVMYCTAVSRVAATSGIPGSPKLLNPYLGWEITEANLPRLARWDVVILDADQQARVPDRIRKLRALNPSIKILAYIASEEIATARFSEPVEFPIGNMATQIQDVWYVRDPVGNKVFFWPGSAMLNVTNVGPPGATGERWNEFLPRFIHEHILSSGLWDGIFLDNTFNRLSDHLKTSVDLDRDGIADARVTTDAAWRNGMFKMIHRLRELNPNAILMGNGGLSYAGELHGVLFENYPSWNWSVNWQEFRQSLVRSRSPSISALNVNTKNENRPGDYKRMRYGLANALVGGGYYSFDTGDADHHTLWWYDEYETRLGTPRGEPRTLVGGRAMGVEIVPAVWARDFQNGIVMFNSTNALARVSLPGEFEKLRGTQDPATNDGTIVRTIELASEDGLLLLRRSEPGEIRGSAFENGSFVRMYDARGRQVQAGFFAQRNDVPGGALVLASDLDRDGREDIVFASRGLVSVRLGRGVTRFFRPFVESNGRGIPRLYSGKISIATGNTDRDAAEEIIVGRSGAPPEVKIFSADGKLLASWLAYQAKFAGGVRVAIGDLDGDGKREIVTAAGPGGGPHLRVWKTDGSVWGGGWFAFDATDRGGVEIAVGDVDGDGKNDIVAVSGQGAIPRMRIFDGRGTLKADIVLGSRPLAAGLRVALSDLNGDGVKEIFIGGLPIF